MTKYKKNGQRDRLLERFLAGRSINRMQALALLGIFELSSTVIKLEREGYIISRKPIKFKNKFGEKCRGVQYWLDMDQQSKTIREALNND